MRLLLEDRSTLSGQLERLLATGSLSRSTQRAGTHLLKRLKNDIRVILAGPQEAGKVSVLQSLSTRALPQTQVRNIPWGENVARDGADVCVWFTQVFAADEFALWDVMPNRLKDHSFLVPVLPASAPCPAFMESMAAIAIEEFSGLCSLILSAPDGPPQIGGIDNLVDQIASTIKSGLAADADNLRMFLAQHAMDGPDPQPDMQPVQKPVLTAREPLSGPQMPEPPQEPCQYNHSDRVLFQAAHDGLCVQITALEPLMNACTEAEFAQVLSICQETIEEAAIILAECQVPGWDDVQSAADEVLLMSMEGGFGPALAAVTTLLQIKRQLEVEVGANESTFT